MLRSKSKNFVALCCAIALVLTSSISAFAATSPKAEAIGNAAKTSSEAIQGVPNGNFIPMGSSKPTQTWNWSSGSYNGSADFNTAVYSNYNFQPSSSGELYVDFSGSYKTTIPPADTAMTIECINSSDGSYVSWQTVIPSSSGEVSGGVRFYNLTPSAKYFFRISKPYPEDAFHLDFTVYQ